MRADLLVIGSGQAGVPLATRFTAVGKSVVVFERGDLGGTCVNVGCTPTKTMVASARAAHVARNAERLGIRVSNVEVDFGAIIERKAAIVRRWRAGIENRLEKADAVRVVRAHARFVRPGAIEAGGELFEADTIVINVGARPFVPTIEGLAAVSYLTNATLMELRDLPRRLIVLGGGYIGCEFAQMFRRFGSEVTILERGKHLLGREDTDVSAALEGVFAREGIVIQREAEVSKVARTAQGEISISLRSGKTIAGSHLLVATSRRPNTDDLGCDAAGVQLDARGFVVTRDDFTTTAPGVFAVGDVCGGPQFTHTSWDDHRLLFERLLGRSAKKRSERFVPYTVYTDPQVAGVGLSEREARERGLAVEVATMPFGSIARAIETDETAGTMKVLLDPKNERIVGARLVGTEAGELIHVFVALMEAGASARAIVDAEFVHPSFAEGLQSLVMKLDRYALS